MLRQDPTFKKHNELAQKMMGLTVHVDHGNGNWSMTPVFLETVITKGKLTGVLNPKLAHLPAGALPDLSD